MNNLQQDIQELILIPFTSDYGFKVTFGNESDTLFLRKALQALIRSDIPIQSVQFTKNEFTGVVLDSRSGIYDLTCVDDNGNTFIVEMQLGDFKDFFHRMKFYAFQKFNTMVKRGRYLFNDLTPIYCIGILANNINQLPSYYNISSTKNQDGIVTDEQITYVTVELEKFNLSETDIQTDLEKLIFTMKNFTQYTTPTQFPQFWNEEWLQIAINELDTRNFTPDQRVRYETILAQNAVAVYNEKQAINKAILDTKKGLLLKLLKNNKSTVEEIADFLEIPVEIVINFKAELEANQA
jgi:predicted transposase/invertase (TIGR01784 family)